MTKQKEAKRLPVEQDRIKALDMQMAWAYKLRRYWKNCPQCYHIIAPDDYPRICQCERIK